MLDFFLSWIKPGDLDGVKQGVAPVSRSGVTMRTTAIACLMAVLTVVSPAFSSEPGYRTFAKSGAYADVRDDLKDAIIRRGFVIDYVGHFNSMLERTADVAGRRAETGRKSPYLNAEYMQFCPAKLTHEAVAANPLAIANCPVALFVYESNQQPGTIHVGFRTPVASPSRLSSEVNGRFTALLEEIAVEATKP